VGWFDEGIGGLLGGLLGGGGGGGGFGDLFSGSGDLWSQFMGMLDSGTTSTKDWLGSAAGKAGEYAGKAGDYLGDTSNYSSGFKMLMDPTALQLGGQVANYALQPTAKQPQWQPQPSAQQQSQNPQQPDPRAIQSLMANRQAQGVSSGGAISPESISALLGGDESGYSPDFIKRYLQQGQG